jgi:hypothetical protein
MAEFSALEITIWKHCHNRVCQESCATYDTLSRTSIKIHQKMKIMAGKEDLQ